MNFKKMIFPIVSLLSICIVVSALIAFTDSLTKDVISRQQETAMAELRQKVMPADVYTDINDTAVSAQKDGQTVGYVFTSIQKGYGGDVTVMVGIGIDGKLMGVDVLSHSETVGIGAVCTEKEFLAQYLGAQGVSDGNMIKKTGASITSRAIHNAVSDAFSQYEAVKGGDAQ